MADLKMIYYHLCGDAVRISKRCRDANPIRTLRDYSKPSHEGYRNTIELPVGNNTVPLRSDNIRTRLRLFQFSLRDQASNWLERLPAGSITTWEDLTTRFLAQFIPPGRTAKLYHDILMFQQHQRESLSEAWTRFKDLLQKFPHHGIDRWLQIQLFLIMSPFILSARLTAPPPPHALGTTFEARVRDYMTAHTKRMERFENAIFKQREEIKDRMAEMFGLLKELTTSGAPEKVLIREEAKSLVTKNVNSISLTKGEEERNDNDDMAADSGINRTHTEMPLKEVEKETEAENRTKNKLIKREETTKASNSQPVGYYLKHKINEKLIEGLVDNHRFNDSLSGIQEDIGENFEIPCNIGGLKCMNALVDQGSDVNVMPLSTYMKLTDEKPAETDIRLSLASHTYIYPLGIAEDVLVDVVGYVYPMDFMILDIKEDKKGPSS
nr:hypothetical protein [Tanacetum cinerariifolium]